MAFPLFTLGKNILLSNFKPPTTNYKLTFAITYRCNARCSTCGIWQKATQPELSLPEIETFFKRNSFSWINLTGGEPFLHPKLTEMISLIQSTNPDLFFLNTTSNGLATNDILTKAEALCSFVKLPKFAIGISLEGPPEIDGKIRNMPGSFAKSLQTFKGLLEIFKNTNYQPFISYTISPQNVGHLEETIRSIRAEIPSFKLNQFHANLFHHSNHYYGNVNYKLDDNFAVKATEEIKAFLAIYRQGLNPDAWLEKKYLSLLPKYLEQKKTPLPCQALRASCFLDPQGNIFPCSMYDKKLGNIKEFDYKLANLWPAKVSQETREIIAKYNCPNCWTPCEAYQTILGNMLKSIRS
ncbi:MAG: radical SAM protein [bacterium]